MSDEEQAEATKNALGVILFQPTPLFILDGRYGLLEKLDFGIKVAGAATRLDGKYWFYHSDAVDVSLTTGYTRHSDIGASALAKGYKLFKFLKLIDYKRKDLDAAILVSSDSQSRVSIYGAVRYIAAFIQMEASLEDVPTENELPGDTDVTMHHFGGTGGIRVKLGPVDVMAELTIMKLQFEPTILGVKTDLGGYLVEPLLGFGASF